MKSVIVLCILLSTITSDSTVFSCNGRANSSLEVDANYEEGPGNDWNCSKIPNGILKCSDNRSMSVERGNCVTYSKSEDAIEVGKCIYTIAKTRKRPLYKEIPITENGIDNSTCEEFNRNRTLCGKCKEDYYPLVYSFNMTCIKCPNAGKNWWKYLLAALLPVTIFYFVILLLNVSIFSSQLHGFFFYSQGVSMPAISRAMVLLNHKHKANFKLLQVLGSLYGVWNLDFFRTLEFQICLGTDIWQTLTLDLAVGVYPFLLMLLTYFLMRLYDRNFRLLTAIWKPFHATFSLFKRNWDLRTSLIDAFATFFILSNVKILAASAEILIPIEVYHLDIEGNMTRSWKPFYNAALPYFSDKHLPYAVLAILASLIFAILPTLLLILYPFSWFQRFLNIFPLRWYILHTFMDSLYGNYKDGTQPGTRDYRWFASMWFIMNLLLIAIGAYTLSSVYHVLASMVLVVFVVALINLEPFKESLSVTSNVVFLLFLSLIYVVISGLTLVERNSLKSCLLIVGAIALILPLFYISALITHWLYQHRKFGLQLIKRYHAWRRAYEILQ